jgi:hypothetical protein
MIDIIINGEKLNAMSNPERPARPLWQVAEELSVEQDSRKLIELLDELMALLEQHGDQSTEQKGAR